MKKIGFLEDEIEGVYRLIAAILHLGNVQFSDTFKNGMDTVNVVDRKGIYLYMYYKNFRYFVNCLHDSSLY